MVIAARTLYFQFSLANAAGRIVGERCFDAIGQLMSILINPDARADSSIGLLVSYWLSSTHNITASYREHWQQRFQYIIFAASTYVLVIVADITAPSTISLVARLAPTRRSAGSQLKPEEAPRPIGSAVLALWPMCSNCRLIAVPK